MNAISKLIEELESEANDLFSKYDHPDTPSEDKPLLDHFAAARLNLAKHLRACDSTRRTISLICNCYEKIARDMLVKAGDLHISLFEGEILERCAIDRYGLVTRLRTANQVKISFKFMLDVIRKYLKRPSSGRF